MVYAVLILDSLVDTHALIGVVTDPGVRKPGWVCNHRLLDQSLIQRFLLYNLNAARVDILIVVEGVFLIFDKQLIDFRVDRLML
jgi:hypothetical protein